MQSHGIRRVLLNVVWIAVTASLVMLVCLTAQESRHVFGADWGMGGLLFWPALVLARAGVDGTWHGVMIAAPVGAVVLAWVIRRRHWALAPAVGALAAFGYCLIGALYFALVPVPYPPVTPYDADATKLQEYRAAFRAGYLTGLGGHVTSYCFMPEHMTSGHYAGQLLGDDLSSRALNRRSARRYLRGSAAIDGVALPAAGPTSVSPIPSTSGNAP